MEKTNEIDTIIIFIVHTVYKKNIETLNKAKVNIVRPIDEECLSDLTRLKIQQLLYMMYGYYYGFSYHKGYKKRLLLDNVKFEAWPWGPIIREIYYNSITPLEYLAKSKGIETKIVEKYGEDAFNVLVYIIEGLNKFSAWTLFNMTTLQEPWKNIIEKNPYETQIPNNSIQKYFRENYEIYRHNYDDYDEE